MMIIDVILGLTLFLSFIGIVIWLATKDTKDE